MPRFAAQAHAMHMARGDFTHRARPHAAFSEHARKPKQDSTRQTGHFGCCGFARRRRRPKACDPSPVPVAAPRRFKFSHCGADSEGQNHGPRPAHFATWRWETCRRNFCCLACRFAPQPVFSETQAPRNRAQQTRCLHVHCQVVLAIALAAARGGWFSRALDMLHTSCLDGKLATRGVCGGQPACRRCVWPCSVFLCVTIRKLG